MENILIAPDGTYKLCDFGSCTTNQIPPNVHLKTADIQRMQEDIEKNTTLAYRAPEMYAVTWVFLCIAADYS